MDRDFNPYEANDYITALSCSLVGQTKHMKLTKDSKLFNIYGCGEIEEKYNCSFGLDKGFQSLLDKKGFRVVGVDEKGEARIMMLEGNAFYMASLFQPQLSSTYENPHPLITEYLKTMVSDNI